MEPGKVLERFHTSLADHLEPGEVVRSGVMGRAGADSSAIPAFLAISHAMQSQHGGRMVVITDRRIVVVRTSVWWGWRVKRVIETFPLGTPVTTKPDGIGALVEVGGHRVHVANRRRAEALRQTAAAD